MSPGPSRLLPAGLCLLLALLLLAPSASGQAAGEGAAVRSADARTASVGPRSKVIAPGLTLQKIALRKPRRRIFVLRVDVSQPVTMDVALARERFPGFETTSSMGKRNAAVAAVNGDFGGFEGVPTHPFAEDGDLKHSSLIPGVTFAVSADEQTSYMDHPVQSVVGVRGSNGETLPIDHWNDGPPALGEIAGYTPVGGTLEPPPPYACSAQLLASGPPSFATPGPGVSTDYTVQRSACQAAPMARGSGIVLSALPGTDQAQQLLSLAPGESVRITWSFGFAGILDAIGGVPLLVKDGQVVVTNCTSSFCHRNPRTGVGITADGKVLLVVVDGRKKKWSVGFSLEGFARFFVQLGAVTAVNLDGGGSTTMWIKGKVVNRPSDGRERSVSSALLVLPGPDSDEPPGLGPPTIGGGAEVPPPGPAVYGLGEPGWTALLDPGSTGGMLDALARGEIGPPGYRLPAGFRRILERFRERRL